MKRLSFFAFAVLFIATPAHSCSWVEGYFHQVSLLRGTVVGAKMGPLQYARWLRQSFARRNVRLTLYQYRRPITRFPDAPVVKTTNTDKRGRFDFGDLQPGHYTLVLEDADWGKYDSYDVEVTQNAPGTVSVTVDISPNFPDCKGGHEFIV